MITKIRRVIPSIHITNMLFSVSPTAYYKWTECESADFSVMLGGATIHEKMYIEESSMNYCN